MTERRRVRMSEFAAFAQKITRERGGVAKIHIIHDPECPTRQNTMADLMSVIDKIATPGAKIDSVPLCTCEFVDVEIE